MKTTVWTQSRTGNSRSWTTAEFPGYEIEKFDDEPFYRVFSLDGTLARSPKFAQAEDIVGLDAHRIAKANAQSRVREGRMMLSEGSSSERIAYLAALAAWREAGEPNVPSIMNWYATKAIEE